MTLRALLTTCAECRERTEEHSLICSRCAPLYSDGREMFVPFSCCGNARSLGHARGCYQSDPVPCVGEKSHV